MQPSNPDYLLFKQYINEARLQCHGYQELHAHSEASFRDAVNKVEDFVFKAKEFNRQAFAITDHGNQMRLFQGIKARTKDEKQNLRTELETDGVSAEEIDKVLKTIGDTDSIRYPTDKMWPYVKQYKEAFLRAAKKSLQFIPGIEAYFQPEKIDGNRDSYHLILYAKNWTGQKELFKLQNLAQLNKSPKGKWNGQETGGLPRMTWADLERFVGPGTIGHNNIIATSACVAGYIPSLILRPWKVADRQHEISVTISKLNLSYTEADLHDAEQKLEDAKLNSVTAKTQLRDLKRAEKLNFKKKRAQLAKKVAKLKIVVDSFADGQEQTSMFDAPVVNDDDYLKVKKEYTDAVAVLDAFNEEELYLKDLLSRADEVRKNAENAPIMLISAKSQLDVISKEMRPYMRWMEKYNALEEQKIDPESAYQDAVVAAKRMESIFGHDNFYIELQNHGIDSENYVRPYLYRLIKETGINPTVANDAHYTSKSDTRKRNLIASLRFNTPLSEKESEQGMTELYFKSNEEIEALCLRDKEDWQREIWKQGMENTSKIASACGVYYEYAMHLPEFDAKSAGFANAHDYLDDFCRKMIPKKYPKKNMSDAEYTELMKTVNERLKYELGIIDQMGYNSYIAIVQDFIFYGRNIGGEAAIGPGRGSAAGSIVCYLADITDVDPLRYNLIFERFLNPERVSMPDIDTDLAGFFVVPQ